MNYGIRMSKGTIHTGFTFHNDILEAFSAVLFMTTELKKYLLFSTQRLESVIKWTVFFHKDVKTGYL